MKISNAIRNVESVFSNSPDIVSDEVIESVEFALAAMEKQDPMKVYGDYSCVCGHDLGLDRPTPSYCPQCGQKLDWGRRTE